MRFHTFTLFYPAFLAWLANGYPLRFAKTEFHAQRDLVGLLGDVGGNPFTPTPPSPLVQNTLVITSTAQRVVHDTPPAPSLSPSDPPGPTSTATVNSATLTTSTTKSLSPAALTSMASISTPYPDPATVTYSSVSFQIGYVADAPTTPPGELTEWKVIGIAVITITFIATVIMSTVFFDSWWGFVCAVVCGKRARKDRWLGEETLVPDWEKRSWEFRLANEDGHRYPTMASLESIVKEKERAQRAGLRGSYDIKSPELALGAL